MDFVKFPVDSTIIFPLANSSIGGQLLTEWNQKSRETVANHSNIPYVCGPSYTHSPNDFLISGEGGSVLSISGGYALVNGHFIQLDTSSTIAIELSGTGLSGNLCVGLRAMYANPNTIAASMLTENDADYYEGIKVVILPKNQFHLPEDQGNGQYTPVDQVTAHLKLGEFTFNNNVISGLRPNEDRHRCLDADKISNIDDLIASRYASRVGLDPEKIYSMSGEAGPDGQGGTWIDTTDSTIIWDVDPQTRSVEDTVKAIWLKDSAVSGSDLVEEATVRYDNSTEQLKMILPHKQVRGMKTTGGVDKYYEPTEVVIPAANRATGEGGVLNRSWVNFINGLDDKIATMYRMPGGKMRRFIDVLSSKDQLPQPPIAYYQEQNRDASYYDTRLQYSFNLLQTQVAQLNKKFIDFESDLETKWKASVTSDVTATLLEQGNVTQSNLDSLRRDLSNFQGDLVSVSSSIADASSEIAAHLDAYKALAARVTVLENRYTAQLPASSNDTPDYQAEIEALQADVASLSATIMRIQSSVSNSVQSTASTLDTLYQSLYGSSKDGSSGDIKGAEISIELLRSQYDYLYDAIHDLYNGITAEVQKATSTLQGTVLKNLEKQIQDQIAALAEQYNVTAEWTPGDYVLVAQDMTITTQTEAVEGVVAYPSTMYVVVPGMTPVDSKYVASYYDVYTTDLSTPINRVNGTGGSSSRDVFSDALDTYKQAVATVKRQVPSKFVYGYELGGNDVEELASETDLPDVYNSTEMLNELYNSTALIQGVRGVPGKDYFVLRYRYPLYGEGMTGTTYTDEISGETYEGVQYQVYRWVSVFFTLNLVSDKVELDVDNPIILSGGTPYAEESRVGGFLNVGSDVLGSGYVSRDEAGHLRLNDFELLAAGVSAYQLGEDRSEGAGLNIADLQNVFDQYVNQRIAFPNDYQLYRASEKGIRSDVITIELNIGSTSEGTLNIYDIDSRFNTSVHLKISGSATENVVINIKNCQRLRISMDPTSSPTIFLDNVCLYYDADIIDRIAQIRGLTLWYDKFDETDPELEIDGMTVIYQGKLEPKGTERFWNYASGNDNCYAYALRQITFASDGTIIGAGIAVTDNTTQGNIPIGEKVFASTFTLPQSIGLSYPVTKLTKQIKVTGTFITAYYGSDGYTVKTTTFTMLTQKYLQYTSVKEFINGVISFYTRTSKVTDVTGVDEDTLMALNDQFAIDGWDTGAYHIFYGGAVE